MPDVKVLRKYLWKEGGKSYLIPNVQVILDSEDNIKTVTHEGALTIKAFRIDKGLFDFDLNRRIKKSLKYLEEE
jgi:hypothetical protein